MEDITLERLYENFEEVIAQIDDIVARNDIEAARRVLEQIKEIVSNEEHVRLDDDEPVREATGAPYDHVLHRLLDNIDGVIRTANRIEEDEELRGYISRRREIDIEIRNIDQELEALGDDGFTKISTISIEEINQTLILIQEKIRARERVLRNPRTTEATRQRILLEINQLTAYLHQLEIYASGREGVDTSYLDKEIKNIEREIRRAERRLRELDGQENQPSDISQEIARLEAERERITAEADGVQAQMVEALERDGNIPTELTDQMAPLRAQLDEISIRLDELYNIRSLKSGIASLERDEEQVRYAIEHENNEQYILDEFNRDLEKISAELADKRGKLQGNENKERIASLETTIASYDADIENLEQRFPSLDQAETERLEQLRREREQYQKELEERRIRQEVLDQFGPDRIVDNTEREDLEALLTDRRARLEELQTRRTQIQDGSIRDVNIAETEVLIQMLQMRLYVLEREREAARRNSKRSDIARIEEEIAIIQKRITLIQESQQLIGQDNSERRNELLARREALITERDQLDIEINRKRRELLVPGERLDLGEAAREIGDHIFKAADIRQELLSRGYTREDFLRFYRQGRADAESEMVRIQGEIQEIERTAKLMITDESGVNLYEQYKNAPDEATKRAVLEKIRQKVQASSPEMAQALTEAGFDQDLTTASAEDVARFEEFFANVRQETNDRLMGLRAEFKEHDENIKVFDREIKILEAELETIEERREILEDGGKSLEEELELRKKQVRATVFDDPEMVEEWNQRVDRFLENKATRLAEYRDKDGQAHRIEIDTIKDYPEYEEDAKFLNLENYRRYAEATSLYDKVLEAGDEEEALAAYKSFVNLESAEYEEYRRLVDEGHQDQADEWLKNYIAEQKDYVRSYHGFTNKHAVRYATLRTAGSTLQAMLPVRGDLPTTTKMKNALSNVGRFMMLRMPHFTRTNSKGEKVPNTLGGLATLGLDALVVGGAAAAVITGGVAGLIPLGIYYGAKGIVTAGNVIAAKREQRRFGEDIDSNKPTLTPLTARDKEVMRRDHYRDVENFSRPRAWIRAKLDKYFTKRRGEETDQEIVDRTYARVEATRQYEEARRVTAVGNNARRAVANQRVRLSNMREELGNASTYNDIVRDPDSVDVSRAEAIAAQNAAVMSQRPDATRRDVNPNSTVARNNKYTKEQGVYGQTSELESTDVPVGTASVSAITVDQKYRSAMERQDAINRVLTMILTTAGNIGFAWARGRLRETKFRDEKQPDTTETRYRDKPVYREETEMVDDYGTVTRTEVNPDTKVSDLSISGNNYENTYWAANGNPSSVGGNPRVDGVAVRFRDANGNGAEWSAAEPGSHIIAGQHVHGTFSGDISDGTVMDMFKALRQADPSGYQQYCQQAGLDPNNMDGVVQYVLENNDLWVQSSDMEGWSQMLGGGLRDVSEQVVIGQHQVTNRVLDHIDHIPYTVVVPGETIQVPYEVFSGTGLLKSALDGLLLGGVGTGIDALHEVASPTDKTLRGNFEEVNPDLTYSAVAKAAQDEYDREHYEEREEEEEHDEPGEPGTPENPTSHSGDER